MTVAVPYMSLRDLYMRLGLLSEMEPMTEEVMRNRAERELVEDEHDSPHKLAWNLSMHGSSFPGDPAEACARKLVYRMMNVPSARGIVEPWVTTTATLGKAGEMDVVEAWFKDGRMLAIPEDPTKPEVHQLGFVDREHWLTCSTDLPILPRGHTRCHIVEIKAKSDDVLVEMLQGRIIERNGLKVVEPKGPDIGHVVQLKCTIGLAHEYDWGQVTVCKACWRILFADVFGRLRPDKMVMNPAISPDRAADVLHECPWCEAESDWVTFDLQPPTTGELYYWSRSWPRGHPRHGKRTKTFFFEHDPAFMESGRAVLREARDSFVAGALPRRPRHMQWGLGACRFCNYKPICRLDEGVQPNKRKATTEPAQTLAESNAVEHALSIRPRYSYEETRVAVLAQWNIDGEET
jgi:hypothetical protein